MTDGISQEGYTKISRSYGSFNSQKSTVKYSTGLINNKFEFSGRHSKIKSDGYIDRASSNLKSYFFQGLYKNDKRLFKLLVFGGSEITYQSWYGVDPFTLKNDRTYNFAGEIYNSNNELLGFYDNQVDNYKQDHYQFHWNEKINANLNLSIGLNYTYGRGFYEEYNNNQTLKSLKLEDINIGGEKIIETDNVGQKWLDNDNYITTLSLQYFTNGTKIIFGGSYGRYIGDHFGKMVWAKFSSNASPNHEFYYNQGKKNDGNIYIKLTQKINRKLSLFGDFQLRKVSYKVNGEVNGPSKISVNDSQRIIRSLSVIIETGKPFTFWHSLKSKKLFKKLIYIFISHERDELYQRINKRCEKIINYGGLDEVNDFLDIEKKISHPLHKSIGFQIFKKKNKGILDYDEALDMFKVDTRRYAKRQITWFKNKSKDAKFLPYNKVESFILKNL